MNIFGGMKILLIFWGVIFGIDIFGIAKILKIWGA